MSYEKNTIKKCNLWVNKYRPTTISEIVGNGKQLELFDKWLTEINIAKKYGYNNIR